MSIAKELLIEKAIVSGSMTYLTDCSLEWRNMGGYKVITYNSGSTVIGFDTFA